MIVYTSTALSINPEQTLAFKRMCHNVIARSEATKQSHFSPSLEKGDRGGFEIATLPLVARNDKREFSDSLQEHWELIRLKLEKS